MSRRRQTRTTSLPGERHHLVSWQRLAATLALTIVLLAGANVGFGRYLQATQTNLGYYLIDAKWGLLRSLEEPVDTLILGDSSGNQGVMPTEMDAVLGGRCVNLCTLGDLTVLDDLLMLIDYLDRFPGPERIVVVHVYDVWHRGIDRNAVTRIPMGIRMWSELDGYIELSLEDRWHYLLHHHVPIYSQNRSLSTLLMKPWKPARRTFHMDDSGFMAFGDAHPREVHNDAQSHKRFVRNNTYAMSPANRKALESLLVLAESHGIEVFIANAPVYEGLASDPHFVEYIEAMNRDLDEIASGHREVHHVLREPVTFPLSQMVNFDHLTVAGARLYTKRLLQAIQGTGQGS